MKVICENCGSEFRVKEDRVKGRRFLFVCLECSYENIVDNSQENLIDDLERERPLNVKDSLESLANQSQEDQDILKENLDLEEKEELEAILEYDLDKENFEEEEDDCFSSSERIKEIESLEEAGFSVEKDLEGFKEEEIFFEDSPDEIDDLEAAIVYEDDDSARK